jgi:hypothetical protein
VQITVLAPLLTKGGSSQRGPLTDGYHGAILLALGHRRHSIESHEAKRYPPRGLAPR